jgi:hypothetical protein
MQRFLAKYYLLIFTVLILAIAGLSFYVGMLQANKQGSSAVALHCSDTVLSALTIPTKALSEDAAPTVLGTNTTQAITAPATAPGAFAGSKNGTKYYTPGCAGLERIKPENRVWFQSAEDATLQGYTAGSC